MERSLPVYARPDRDYEQSRRSDLVDYASLGTCATLVQPKTKNVPLDEQIHRCTWTGPSIRKLRVNRPAGQVDWFDLIAEYLTVQQFDYSCN